MAVVLPAWSQNLGGMIRETRVDWLAGNWVGQTDQGDRLELSYAWELPSALILQKFKAPDREGRAMIFVDPVSNKVVHQEVGSDGSVGKGEWTAEEGKATLRYTGQTPEGETRRMGFVMRRIDADTMEVEVREWRSDGVLGDTPWATLRFRRQK